MSDFNILNLANSLEGVVATGVISLGATVVETTCFTGARILQREQVDSNWETAKKVGVYALIAVGVAAGVVAAVSGGLCVGGAVMLIVAGAGGGSEAAFIAGCSVCVVVAGTHMYDTLKTAKRSLNVQPPPPPHVLWEFAPSQYV